MIKIDSVTKSFGDKKVLENLSLEVKDGEILSLLGPNGCGKTTLLNILSGLTKQNSGNIYINDILVSGKEGTKKVHFKPSERKVGYVFQTVSLFPHMRIQDNIAFGLKSLHLPRQEVKKRTSELLSFVGLSEYAKFYPSQLSGGQRQRTALARSLATEPQVLLLDEPVSAVDPQLRESFRIELKNYLQALKITVVYVTHNLSEAFIMSDRIAVMGNGQIEQIDSRAQIFEKPTSKYVAQFLGINAFNGRVVRTQGELCEIDVNGVLLLAPAAPELVGKDVVITVKQDDILLSKSGDASKISGFNMVKMVVTEMVQMRSTTLVTLEGGVILKTRLSTRYIKNLGLNVGDQIYATFKTDALNIFLDKN
jgi:ABC-type Fe3+/spermidine/putrescine transport system ATPase subunit